MEILDFEDLGDTECHLAVISNFNSSVPQGGIYPRIKFERDPLNIVRIRALTSSGLTGGGRGRGGDAKTITSFGDIISFYF